MKLFSTIKTKLQGFFSKLGKKTVSAALTVAIIFSVLFAGFDYLTTTRIARATVTLNYEQAKQGLNPDGSKFTIADIKSDEVIKNAISILGDDSLTVDSLKERITIDSKMPFSAIEQTRASIASGSAYNYNPSEFDIYYSQEKKLAENNTNDFLEALTRAYYDYFITTYSDKNIVLEFDGTDNFEDYDYYEIYKVLDNKINSMINYLGSHQAENTTYYSSKTGYTYENLITMLVNLRDKDLEKYRAHIIQNKISKDTSGFIGKQEYLINVESINYTSNMEASDIANNALTIYDPKITGVTFIPTIDRDQEYYMGRTKTGIDTLVMRSYDLGERANQLNKSISEREYLIEKFTAETDAEKGAASKADAMITDLCVFLEKISTVAILTDDDYISEKTYKYITFDLPEDDLYIPIVAFAGGFVLMFAAMLVLIAIVKKFQDESEKNEEAVKPEEEECEV